jgi:hypothetical protein
MCFLLSLAFMWKEIEFAASFAIGAGTGEFPDFARHICAMNLDTRRGTW